MKKREILCLLTGCVLLLTPLPAQAKVPSLTVGVEAAPLEEEESEATNFSIEKQERSGEGNTQNVSGNSTDDSAEKKDGEDKQDSDKTPQSVLDGFSVGSGLIGSGTAENIEETEEAEKSSSLQEALGEPVGAEAIFQTKTERDYAEAYAKAQNANWGYTNLGIANVESGNLNVRAAAAEDGKLVGKLPRNAACEVLDSDGVWAHIKSGKVEGYVSCEYLLTGIPAKRRAEELAVTVAKVATDGLKVRAEASLDAEVITLVADGEELEVADVVGDWVRVYLDDEEVYVSADYVEVSSELATAVTMTELLYGQGVSDVRVDLCQYAKEFIGNPYVWGGTSLTKGADCSGFVLSVFKKYGVNLPHSSRAQANSGTTIKVSEAQPGDLIFYSNGSSINHVAIYIGGGQVVHASNPKTGIRISNVSYRSPVKAVRILQD